jgi:hypothetical protein
MADDYTRQSTILRQRIAAQVSPETATKMLKVVTAMVRADLDEYPPPTQANQPWGFRGDGYYIRNRGWQPKNGPNRNDSQQVSKRWDEQQHGSYRRDLTNNAGYVGYLMGNPQVAWAKARGWPNAKKKLKERGPDYLEAAGRVVAEVNRGTG